MAGPLTDSILTRFTLLTYISKADPHVLSGGHLIDELDLPALEACLQRLTREEHLVVFLSLKDNDDEPHLLNQTVRACVRAWGPRVCMRRWKGRRERP